MNKRKILEAARKLAQKGSKEKALVEYQKLLKLDSKDAKLRLEIGDAHRRWGQVEQAVETYTRVAEQYMNEGFDARAVAVFKQILNLDPDHFDAYAPLAELYERMGLTAEAIASLQTAADGLHRQGRKDLALELLRKMANVDPANTTSRIKVADLLRQQQKNEDAITEYRLAAEELERHGDLETVGNVYRRILEIDEKNVLALGGLAANLASRGKVSEAILLAERALQLDAATVERYELLADLFGRANRPGDRERVLRSMAELFRERGDEDRAKDILQRCVSAGELAGNGGPDALEAGGTQRDDGALFDDHFPDSEGAPEFSIDFGSDMDIDPGSSMSGRRIPSPLDGPGAPAAAADDEPEELLLEEVAVPPPVASAQADVDVDQLLAEATVYLRYGKCEKAIAHLERVIAADPDHRGALEKLGEAFAENGENARAVDVWLHAANAAHAAGDVDSLRVLRGRISVLDETAAARVATGLPAAGGVAGDVPGDAFGGQEPTLSVPPVPVAPDFDAGHDDDDDLMIEDDDEFLDDVDGGEGIAAPVPETEPDLAIAGPTEEEAPELALGADPELEIDVDVGFDDDVGLDEGEGLGDGGGLDEGVELDDDLEADSDPRAAPPGAPAAPSASDSLGASAKQQVLDDLEEADFYVQQGLHQEAEAIYQRVLAIAPNHPRALLRLGEIAAARGETPAGPAVVMDDDQTPVPGVDLDEEDDLGASDAVAARPSARVGEAPAAELEDLSDLDLAIPEDADDAEPAGDATGSLAGESAGGDTQELRPGLESSEGSAASAPQRGGPVSPPLDGSEGDFDLAAALSDAFDDDPGASQGAMTPATDDGFASVFAAFKKGVRETLSEGDHQAHYDLAIAYKEMGLLDDAITELRTAMADPSRTVECLHLIGLCAIDADQAPLAVEHLEQLLTLPDLDADASAAAHFDLGRALDSLGDVEGARRAWQRVSATHPHFQDVAARLAGLGAPKPAAAAADDLDADLAGADGGFESFDDVMDGIGDEAEILEVGAGQGETFEDLLAEASDEDDADDEGELDLEVDVLPALEDVADPSAEALAEEPGSADAPAAARPEPPKPGAKRKKKRISFL